VGCDGPMNKPFAGRPLKVGFLLPEVERPVGWREMVGMARLGEQLGFDSIWVSDHLLYRDEIHSATAPWEAWTILAGIAASTSRIAIGPLVACTSFHNPAMLAKLATTVDEISGGRLILGLGAGWNETEYRAYGLPFDRRVSRFAEAFTIIRSLLRDGWVDFAGQFYQARDCELVPRARPGGPPLLVGSTGDRMLAITIPHVDAWNAWFSRTGNRPEGIPALRAKVDAACVAAHRDPSEIERTVAVLIRFDGATGIEQGRPAFSTPALEGPPELIAEALRGFAHEGIGQVQLVLDPITEASLEAMAPVLAHLDATGQGGLRRA
jgi:alkanesulfonate monooxygenase SsuD/methylene tetrahydromethanopterin reductase-like flavin-dependent oxidoreductase (luciferase family)